MSATLRFKDKNPWIRQTRGNWTVYTAGFINSLDDILAELQNPTPNNTTLGQSLKSEKFQFGLIIEGPDTCFAAVDRTRSWSIFWNEETQTLSNYAQNLGEPLKEHSDKTALLEFINAGYTLGSKTLHSNIQTLQGGQFFLKTAGKPAEIEPYYSYRPLPQNITEQEALKKLSDVMDEIITGCLDRANGAPIWVPLSGGYDSRLILAKLVEHGAPNLQSFSYGIKNNDEARTACHVAEMLGVPWQMLPANSKKAKSLYYSDFRKKYEDFCHGYESIPSYVEFQAFQALNDRGVLAPGSFILNGQSGDFITGGHIPKVLYESADPSQDDMMTFILEKHFSLWPNFKTPENEQYLKQSIESLLLPDHPNLNKKENLIRQYEAFEWIERQCKMVVNGQKTYDFFGYNWLLPLWNSTLMDFFETLPFDLKYQQKLFINYLKAYNYKGVFNIPRVEVKTWRWHQYWIIGAAKIIELIKGSEAKTDFYKKMAYYGHSHDQYALFGKTLYNQHYRDIRNMVSLSILDFCQNHDLDFPGDPNG